MDLPDLIARLAETAARRAGHTAVCGPDATLTYAQLDGLANRLAGRLVASGIGRDVCAGVSLPRGAAELAAMLAILKAGGAYVPLDPSHPSERLALITEDAAPAVLITYANSPFATGRVPYPRDQVLLLEDDFLADLEGAAAEAGFFSLAAPSDPKQLAYVLFTSGSTGRPKGVEVPRGAFANLLDAMAEIVEMTEDGQALATSPTTFDIAGLERFMPLWVGATVVIADRETVLDPSRLSELFDRYTITYMQATPTNWRLWMNGGWRGHPRLTIVCGGEVMSPELADRLGRCSGHLWNMYGPTETTIISSGERVTAATDPITIGRPIRGTRFEIRDAALNPVPPGTAGEILIAGAGLARGYRGRPELTAELFVSGLPGTDGSRWYRTGDLGCQLPDGRFQFLGRLDDQVKVRGFRIELGEIESALRQAPGVRDGAVVARTGADGEGRLVAYVLASADAALDVKALRSFLQAKLPAYMVPAMFVRLAELPVNANGKIDRPALLARTGDVAEAAGAADPPRDDRERRLLEIWRGLLPGQQFGVRDSFFDLGGNSLLAVTLMVEIEKAFGRTLLLSALLTDATIEKLAALLGPCGDQPPAVVELRGGQTGPPVFFIHDGVGEILLYRNLARRLRPGYPVYGIQPVGRDGCPMIHTRWPEMVDHYVSEIRRIQPEGPYFLGGLSTGGIIALEVARRLKVNQSVAMVALFDTAHLSAAARRSLASQRLQRFAAVFGGDDSAPFALAGAATNLRAAARKVLNVLAYEARRRAEEASLALRIDLLALAQRFGRRPPRLAQAIAPRLILKRLQKIYAPAGRYEGEVILFRASRKDPRLDGTLVDDTPCVDLFADPLLGWEANVARVRVEEVPGGHVSLLMEPHVKTLAERIQGHIQRGVDVPGDGCVEAATPPPLRARSAR